MEAGDQLGGIIGKTLRLEMMVAGTRMRGAGQREITEGNPETA